MASLSYKNMVTLLSSQWNQLKRELIGMLSAFRAAQQHPSTSQV